MLAAVVLLLQVTVASGSLHVHDTCAETKCSSGDVCKDTPDGPKCVPIQRPGECPLYKCARPVEPPNCNDTCTVDSDCKRNDKCCRGCNGCYSCVMAQIASCASIRCIQDTTCIETPTGPQCVPNKPGECPLYECARPLEPPICNDTCTVDSDCIERNDKCCRGCNGCYSCVMAQIASCASILCIQDTTCIETPTGPQCVPNIPGATCASIRCRQDTTCIETPTGPQCVPNKPGLCPLFGCPVPLVRICKDTCRSDQDCKRGNKCCIGCDGCRSCMAPIYISPCDKTKCLAGHACVMHQVQCPTTPCDPIPTCVDTAPKPGRCPVIKQGGVSTCEITCQYDSQCGQFQKCCKNACGGTACTDPEPEHICNMMCVINTTCRIVLDRKTGAVSPQCVEVPSGGDNDNVCFPGSPLLVRNNNGQVSVSFCGRGPQRIDCPDGYHCKIAPDDRYAVCCPEVCSLPKVVGMCKAAISSFYFDHNSRLCKRFYYGGCGGNANRFPTRRACKRACGFKKCPQIPEMKCASTWNQCTKSGEYPKVCPPGQTCCKTPCGRRCYVP